MASYSEPKPILTPQKDVDNIIYDYVAQLEHTEKFQKCLQHIKKMVILHNKNSTTYYYKWDRTVTYALRNRQEGVILYMSQDIISHWWVTNLTAKFKKPL